MAAWNRSGHRPTYPCVLRVGARTDIGLARDNNEDSYLVGDRLFAVADGMGGHAGGEFASALALQTLAAQMAGPPGKTPALGEMFRRAHRAILERAEREAGLQGMGTTLSAILLDGLQAEVSHVGDSRVYLLRDDALRRLTEDDSLAESIIRKGGRPPGDRHDLPPRNILTQALGVDAKLAVHELRVELRLTDRLLLCTDGLTGIVDDESIKDILRDEADPQSACDQLVDAANQATGIDNITVIIVDVLGRTDDSPPT
jgi:protein phosphatase